ncbi:MAG: phosphoribosylglycinamide formyltransferase [Chthoniobacterales bacterium]|nr:phosphoribosylglycinamide formyltransferase [Chthoniobacterales bacterium]
MMARPGLGILGSGKGSNCRAILESIAKRVLRAEARIGISDVPDSGILHVAREFDVTAAYLPPGKFRTKLAAEAEIELGQILRDAGVDWVVLAGWMRVLKEPMLQAFPHRILNIHPSLLPKFPGLEAWKQALAAGETITGCTVHYVDAGVDSGEIIAQREVPILPDDTPETLHARIQIAERELYPTAIRQVCA